MTMLIPDASLTFYDIPLIREIWAMPNRIFTVGHIRKLIQKKYRLKLTGNEKKMLGRRLSICLFWMIDTQQGIQIYSQISDGKLLFQKVAN
jgi:hypothetical protein